MKVLFLMCDELSWWGLGHTNPRALTPNIDRLAASARVFSEAYTPSPICVPTRAAIATGKYVHEIGNWSSAEPYEGTVPSYGHQLQAADIPVRSIGKLHYRGQEADTGFDEQIVPVHVLNGVGWIQGLLRNPLYEYDETVDLAVDIGPGNSGYLEQDRSVTAAAVDWLGSEAAQAANWCTFVSWLAPHFPLIAPQEFYDLYDPEDFDGLPEPPPDHPILDEIRHFFNHEDHFDPETRKIAKASYYALCSFLDAEVGKVLDALDQAGLTDDTLIIFTSDHGEMLGEKGFWTKSTMYDSAAKVPLILSGPGVKPGQITEPVSLIDIPPTIAECFGLSKRPYSGKSLLGDIAPNRTVLSEYHDGGCSAGFTMVRWNDGDTFWKYIHYAEGHPPQLFDLTSDPREETNLAAKHPDICVEATSRLARWMDPEAINKRAHAEQAAKVKALGGREKVLAYPQFNYTPADSR